MQTSAPQRARWSGLVDYKLRMEQADGLVWPQHVFPSAQWDHGRGHGEGGCGYSCGRLGWEAAVGQGVQICEELVLVSSTAGRVACLLHCLAGGEGRELCFCVVLAGMCNPGVLRPSGEVCGSSSSGFRLSIKTIGWNWGSVRRLSPVSEDFLGFN